MLRKKKSLVGTHEAHEIQAVVVRSGHNNRMQHHVLDLTWCHEVDLWELMMKCQYKDQKRHVFLFHIMLHVNVLHLTILLIWLGLKISEQTVSTRRITFKCPPNPLDRAEPPERTRADSDDDSAVISAYNRDPGRVSEICNVEKGASSGTRMPDMSDSASLAIETNTKIRKSESTMDENDVEPSQKDVDNLLVKISFSSNEETTHNTFAAILMQRQPSM